MFNSYDLKSGTLQLGHWEPPQRFVSLVSVSLLLATHKTTMKCIPYCYHYVRWQLIYRHYVTFESSFQMLLQL
jgi:hypothetical protein